MGSKNNKAIQILRGSINFDPSIDNLKNADLQDGQPFYSKKTRQLYIGDLDNDLLNNEATSNHAYFKPVGAANLIPGSAERSAALLGNEANAQGSLAIGTGNKAQFANGLVLGQYAAEFTEEELNTFNPYNRYAIQVGNGNSDGSRLTSFSITNGGVATGSSFVAGNSTLNNSGLSVTGQITIRDGGEATTITGTSINSYSLNVTNNFSLPVNAVQSDNDDTEFTLAAWDRNTLKAIPLGSTGNPTGLRYNPKKNLLNCCSDLQIGNKKIFDSDSNYFIAFDPDADCLNFSNIGIKFNHITADGIQINSSAFTYEGSTKTLSFDGNISTTESITAKQFQSDGSRVIVSDDSIICKTSNSTESIKLSSSDGTIKATTFYATSDKRLKENITPYISKKSILDLPVYEFDYTKTKQHTIGCLAQDLQEICPEIVNEGEDGYLSINESKLIYLLLEEVKQLKKRLDDKE